MQDDWKPFLAFVVPSKSTDLPLISMLSEVIGTGVRKLFSVIDCQSLLDEVSVTFVNTLNTCVPFTLNSNLKVKLPTLFYLQIIVLSCTGYTI